MQFCIHYRYFVCWLKKFKSTWVKKKWTRGDPDWWCTAASAFRSFFTNGFSSPAGSWDDVNYKCLWQRSCVFPLLSLWWMAFRIPMGCEKQLTTCGLRRSIRFLIYINNVAKLQLNWKLFLFADETPIFLKRRDW